MTTTTKTKAPELCYSTNGEDYMHDSLSDVLQALDDDGNLDVGQTYFVGDKTQPAASSLFDADRLIEDAQERAYDMAGEYADDFLTDLKPEERGALQALIEGWADKHVRINFWTVWKTTECRVTAEDIAEFRAPNTEGGAA